MLSWRVSWCFDKQLNTSSGHCHDSLGKPWHRARPGTRGPPIRIRCQRFCTCRNRRTCTRPSSAVSEKICKFHFPSLVFQKCTWLKNFSCFLLVAVKLNLLNMHVLNNLGLKKCWKVLKYKKVFLFWIKLSKFCFKQF